ncbi:uncharacterized protein LOC114538332 [Dendronephthya gigantea]|uniref:uncharacterized protein LOC114538332 n=1 Tax=Dendronephthya gigantea TaxID=151771 RepID=UPI00106C8BDC|nr:uncharacterized protein LOC114538332 [Dendronephthya gigantea]
MNGEANIQRKSKSVVLCRSRKQPDGKEIQGLVFDHPSMPKIVTVSSVPKKSGEKVRSGETNPTGGKRHTGETHLVENSSPTGRKYPTGRPRQRRYPVGNLSLERFDTGYSNQRAATTQHYPTVQRSPPALIHTPSRYSTEQRVISPQTGKTNVPSPPFYNGRPIPPTISKAHNMQMQYPRHAANLSPRTQEATIRRNSTGTFRSHPENVVPLRQNIVQHPKNAVQYQENIVLGTQDLTQHRQSIGQQSESGIQLRQNVVPYSENGARARQYARQLSMPSSTDRFSRDFHLKVWRQSHDRAAREWYPPASGQEQPAHQPLASNHNLEVLRHRSLSTGSHERPGLVHRNEMVENPPHRETHPQPIGQTLPVARHTHNP